MSALEDIAAERKRQLETEGWTPEHDDGHQFQELAQAAACYTIHPAMRSLKAGGNETVFSRLWPWDWQWFKPSDRRRDLIKAAALIVAEIERLDRKSATSPSDPAALVLLPGETQ